MGFQHDGRSVYFCIDVEASGQTPGQFSLLSIGGVVVRWSGDRHRRGDNFYVELRPHFEGWSPAAEKIHRLTRPYLETNGVEASEAMLALGAWVKTQLARRERPVFVGHNAPFDWMFIAWYFAEFGVSNPFGYKAIDTKALMMGKHRIPWKDSHKEKLADLYPHLHTPPPDKTHNALVDAEFQADILIALLDD